MSPLDNAEEVRPHRFPDDPIARRSELLGWRCQACQEWISESGPDTDCSIDWRAQAEGAAEATPTADPPKGKPTTDQDTPEIDGSPDG